MFLVHPVVLAVVPVLFLYSANWGQVPFTDALIPAAISLGLHSCSSRRFASY